MPYSSEIDLNRAMKARGEELGFSLVGITAAARPETLDHFHEWLQNGMHGTMEYLPRRQQAYEHPQGVQVGVRSIILAGMNYGPGLKGVQDEHSSSGRIAAYAQGSDDYHDILREKLQALADELHRLVPGARTRIAVDTAPLLERDFARKSGLGWFGKNTMLINRKQGSYFFLGAILTDVEIAPDQPHQTDHCGTCTRCLTACPTDAFEAPHVLNASRCISYLTIELRNEPIPMDLRPGVGEWLFGCDVCQQVCPWNRKAPPASEPAFVPQLEQLPQATELLTISEEDFRKKYGKTPFARPGREGMARNAAIVLGNRRSVEDLPMLWQALSDPSPLIRGAVAWAIGQFSDGQFNDRQSRDVLQSQLAIETDESVIEEIRTAISQLDSHASQGTPSCSSIGSQD